MEAGSIAALLIILGVGYWMNQRSNTNEDRATKQKAQDDLANVREKARTAIRTRASNFGVDYTDDELDWICDNAEAHSGREGLVNIGKMFATAPRERLEELMMKIEKDHMIYLVEQQTKRLSDDAERRWNEILEDFKKMNPAQRKAHLAYIKKHTDELSEEQLHILTLLSLGDASDSLETDIMLGNTKLLSVRKKQ